MAATRKKTKRQRPHVTTELWFMFGAGLLNLAFSLGWLFAGKFKAGALFNGIVAGFIFGMFFTRVGTDRVIRDYQQMLDDLMKRIKRGII